MERRLRSVALCRLLVEDRLGLVFVVEREQHAHRLVERLLRLVELRFGASDVTIEASMPREARRQLDRLAAHVLVSVVDSDARGRGADDTVPAAVVRVQLAARR